MRVFVRKNCLDQESKITTITYQDINLDLILCKFEQGSSLVPFYQLTDYSVNILILTRQMATVCFSIIVLIFCFQKNYGLLLPNVAGSQCTLSSTETDCLLKTINELRDRISVLESKQGKNVIINYSNITSFFRFVKKRAIYRLGIISLAHAPVQVTDFPVVNVHVDESSSARIWQHKLCTTLSANVNINYRLPILPYLYSQTYQNRNNSWKPECVLSFNMGWRI